MKIAQALFLPHSLRLIAIIVLLTLTAVSACADAPAALVDNKPMTPALIDPLTILRMFCESLRAGQIDAAMNLLAEEVVLTDATGQVFKGRAAVRAWLSRQDFSGIELCDIWIRGNQIAWTVRVYHDDAEKIGSGRAVIENGKIKLLAEVSW